MLNKKLFNQLKKFDPDLFSLLKNSLDRQISSLSLIPTDNAASPLSQYLKGSALGNDFIGHNSFEHYSRIEQLAIKRACEVFGAENAIVRTGNLIAASRVVLMALAKPGDTILSFNLRKSEHCSGEQMKYNFVNFALEPDTWRLDFDKVHAAAIKYKPSLIFELDCESVGVGNGVNGVPTYNGTTGIELDSNDGNQFYRIYYIHQSEQHLQHYLLLRL